VASPAATRLNATAQSPRARDDGVAPGHAQELPRPQSTPAELQFTVTELAAVRRLVASACAQAQFEQERTEDLTLAINELASNSICHGGGGGTLLLWREESTLVCEVRDRGHIADQSLRRVRPTPDHFSGRGLWLVDQLCDVMQIRSSPLSGTAVRVYMRGA
jgi:anti-sigma regulatory factor (Ser/Thr protein kinase)